MLSNKPRLRALIKRAALRVLTVVERADPDRATDFTAARRPPEHETSDPTESDEAEASSAAGPEISNAEVSRVREPAVPSGATENLATPESESSADGAADIHRSDFDRDLVPGLLAVENATATRALYERLADQDIAEIEQLIQDTPGAWEHYAGAGDNSARRDVLLALGTWLGSEVLIEKTGLVRAQPPEDVHAMTRGGLSAAGGLYEANLIVDALLGGGVEMSAIRSALDFGCSSGRVVRSLAAAYPAVEWHGCDPNEPAIAWAAENLPGIEFFVNEDGPPLPLADRSLDMAYAISIWSHFAPELGLRWFDEMRRLIRPGGCLVVTTHGVTSVAHYALRGLRTPEQSDEILTSLYRRGWWYAPEFGEEGDWGVVSPDWGTAFLSSEWMLTQLCPRWRVLEYAPGRNQENQDIYVLQRV